MRFYIVGTPIQDYTASFLYSVSARTITREELMEAFYGQATVRVFASFDEANEYARGLRENAYDFSHYPKTPISRSKVRPVFTVELDSSLDLGATQSETFSYDEHYVDVDHYGKTRTKNVELHYHEIMTNLVLPENIIRAEFHKSPLQPMELQELPASGCRIC